MPSKKYNEVIAMSDNFSESNYENAVLDIFKSVLGYGYIYGPDLEREYTKPFYENSLLSSLLRINKILPREAINEAILKLENL